MGTGSASWPSLFHLEKPMNTRYEGVDYNDPLSIMLANESDDDSGADELESLYCAARYRARTFEIEKTSGDMLGASPFELASSEIDES